MVKAPVWAGACLREKAFSCTSSKVMVLDLRTSGHPSLKERWKMLIETDYVEFYSYKEKSWHPTCNDGIWFCKINIYAVVNYQLSHWLFSIKNSRLNVLIILSFLFHGFFSPSLPTCLGLPIMFMWELFTLHNSAIVKSVKFK